MNTSNFIDKVTHFSEENELVHTYLNVDNNAKAYDRFLKRLFWVDELHIYTTGWLGELYNYTNGVDLINYYIVPYNNYYNPKKFAYDDFCRGWITNHKNEILAGFYSFMTDDSSLIGFLGQLRDTQGNHFIAYSKTKKRLNDVDVIFSVFFHYMTTSLIP